VRLAGDGVDAQQITLTHDGTGTLPATATTDPSGIATITYTAPAVAQIELVSATITEGGLTTGDAVVITTRPPVTVVVTPSFGFVDTGRTLQFTATVGGTADHRVVWSAGGGSIGAGGLYTAGPTPGTFTVTATSVAEPSVVGTAFVQVNAATDVTGLYLEESCADTPATCHPRVLYQCLFRSVAAGTVCGWFVNHSDVPNFAAARCQIDTDGTRAGGAFTARITSCVFGMTPAQADARITGSIGNGRISFSASADIDRDGFPDLTEHFTGTKWVP
jgi:hypothetical protein